MYTHHNRLSATKNPRFRRMLAFMIQSFANRPITSPITTATWGQASVQQSTILIWLLTIGVAYTPATIYSLYPNPTGAGVPRKTTLVTCRRQNAYITSLCETRPLTFIPTLNPKTAAYKRRHVKYLETLTHTQPTWNTTTKIIWGRQTTSKHAMETSHHDALYFASWYPVMPMSVWKR